MLKVTIGLLIAAVGCLVWRIRYVDVHCHHYNTAALYVWLGVVLFALGILLLIWVISYLESVETAAELESFYQKTAKAYQKAIKKTETITINATKQGLIDVAYNEIAKSVSERIADLCYRIKDYNETLAKYKAMKKMLFVGEFLKALPEELDFLDEHLFD